MDCMDRMDAKTIGAKLRLLRKHEGKTLEEVAEDVGVSRSALAMYEQGHRIPRDGIKVRLAQYYGESVQDIFFD